MRTNFSNTTFVRNTLTFIFLLMINLFVVSCQEDPKLWSIKSTEQVASDYLRSKPEYSEFAKLIEVTGLDAYLGTRGPYTIFIPNNDAMFAYYKEKGVISMMDFDEKFRRKMALNHLVTNEMQTGDFGLGALRDTNAIGDFLVTEFQDSDIILDKYSKIIDRDIRMANGYAHVIDQVIDPLSKDIYAVVSEDPSYKIFTEGLKLTGIKDTLQLISFPYGTKSARTRFTLLAVPDTVYQRMGINNINDLIKWTGANPDSVNFINNPFYRYIEYHCLAGTYYLSNLNTQLYPILSHDNNISMTIDTDYKINYLPKTKKYTSFIVPASNTPAKNGALHAIQGLLPVIEPDPVTILFETTDYFDLKQLDGYGKYYMKWHDGKNTLAKIKWEGDYLQYYYKVGTESWNLNRDCLNMNGFWWVEITTPKIMKGHYMVSGNVWTGWADYDVYIDGVKRTSILRDKPAGSLFGECNWSKTEEHKIKLVATAWSMLFWDTVVFTPVK